MISLFGFVSDSLGRQDVSIGPVSGSFSCVSQDCSVADITTSNSRLQFKPVAWLKSGRNHVFMTTKPLKGKGLCLVATNSRPCLRTMPVSCGVHARHITRLTAARRHPGSRSIASSKRSISLLVLYIATPSRISPPLSARPRSSTTRCA